MDASFRSATLGPTQSSEADGMSSMTKETTCKWLSAAQDRVLWSIGFCTIPCTWARTNYVLNKVREILNKSMTGAS